MPIGDNQADRIQTPKALCNRPVSDNQEDQIQFQRPKALCVQTPFALIEPGGRSTRATARDHRPSLASGNIIGASCAPSLSARSYAFWREERAPRPAPPASSIPRPRLLSRQLVYRFVDVRQSRRTFGRKEASRPLSPPPDRLEPVRRRSVPTPICQIERQ